MIDLDKLTDFLATHARLLDRRRAEIALGADDPEPVLAALAAYRNPDGGFGFGLEPDLRAPSSQPAGALHAFEVLEEIAPATSPLAGDLCDWLAATALPGGALPFAGRGADREGTAPFWRSADPDAPSLHITAAVAGAAHRVGCHDSAVRDHPWLRAAAAWCLDATAAIDGTSAHVLELLYVLQFLDVVYATEPRAETELRRVVADLPAGRIPVAGGAEDESIGPLEISPRPDGPLRALLDADAIREDLDRLEAGQRDDGGWEVDFLSWSPQGSLEWRGYATVRALRILLAHGRIALPDGTPAR
jgi:hypothetical protein